MNKYRPFWKDVGESPSILLITEDCQRVLSFKQWLETEGCRVSSVNINNIDDLMGYCRNILFDLVVLNIETSELTCPKEVYKPLRRFYKNLKVVPALLTLPMVVVTACDQVETIIKRLAVRPVYQIVRNDSTESTVLQTIEQIHYMAYRYV